MNKKIIDYGYIKLVKKTEFRKSKEFYEKLTSNNKQIREQKKLLRDEFPFDELQYWEDKKQAGNISRAKKTFKDIILSNLWFGSSWFVTLTFAEDKAWDLDHLKKEWYNFRRRLPFEVKALAVPEKHSKGDWHLHCIFFDVPDDLRYTDFNAIWGNGYVKIKPINSKTFASVDKLTNYMLGYLLSFEDKQGQTGAGLIKSKKSYWATRNLKRPSVITDSQEVNRVINSLKARGQLVYHNGYNSRYVGLVIQDYYNITE